MTLPYGASKHKIIDAINGLDPVPGPGLSKYNKQLKVNFPDPIHYLVAVGKVIATGPLGTEADYGDYRYWIQLQENLVTTAGTPNYDTNAELNLQDVPISQDVQGDPLANIVTAYDIGDFSSGSRSHIAGEKVELLAIYFDASADGIAPSSLRWTIVGGGGGTLPSPEFQYQILTGVDNFPIWDVDRYAPKVPNP